MQTSFKNLFIIFLAAQAAIYLPLVALRSTGTWRNDIMSGKHDHNIQDILHNLLGTILDPEVIHTVPANSGLFRFQTVYSSNRARVPQHRLMLQAGVLGRHLKSRHILKRNQASQ